jgi:hypothetical protein
MSKNDEAWQRFFDETDTLARIEQEGLCYVSAGNLKQIARREPRLMAKLDTLAVRPRVFKRHALTIFPVKNGEYVIFKDPGEKSYYSFSREESDLPVAVYDSQVDLVSFDAYRGSQDLSECQAIDFAYIVSLIKHFTGDERLSLVIRGRLFSGDFHFCLPTDNRRVDVSGVQIEVDAGYESPDGLYLIEAKVGKRDDFHIRQLYYPFLEWSNRSRKRIVPIFLVYTNGKYYLYEFSFSEEFGVLYIARSGCFAINESPVARIDVAALLRILPMGTEPPVPYPQANDLDKVADLVPRVESELGTKADIADYFEFDERQGDYYANAGCYLGLLEREGQRFIVTDLGRQFTQTRSISGKSRLLIEQMIARPTFRTAFDLLLQRNLALDAVSNRGQASQVARGKVNSHIGCPSCFPAGWPVTVCPWGQVAVRVSKSMSKADLSTSGSEGWAKGEAKSTAWSG